MPPPTLEIDGETLTIPAARGVAHGARFVRLSSSAIAKMHASRNLVGERVQTQRVMYGITTIFGEFSNVSITSMDRERLQRNSIVSHACAVVLPYQRTSLGP